MVKKRGIRVKRNKAAVKARPTKLVVAKPLGLDEAGRKWAALLADPCNATLVSPCYTTGGSGQFIRLRTLLSPLVSPNLELQFTFCPNTNAYWFGQTANPTATGTVGNAQQAFTALPFGSTSSSYDGYRCVAACLSIRYYGTEYNRKGTVGLLSAASPIFEVGQTGVSSSNLLPCMGQITRMGEVLHEVKWLPSATDQQFSGTIHGVPGFANGGALTAVVTGSEPNSFWVELVGCYEVVPGIASGMVQGTVPPTSRNTVSDVMRALGPAARWAYGHFVTPVIKAAAGTAYEAMRTAAPVVAKGIVSMTL